MLVVPRRCTRQWTLLKITCMHALVRERFQTFFSQNNIIVTLSRSTPPHPHNITTFCICRNIAWWTAHTELLDDCKYLLSFSWRNGTKQCHLDQHFVSWQTSLNVTKPKQNLNVTTMSFLKNSLETPSKLIHHDSSPTNVILISLNKVEEFTCPKFVQSRETFHIHILHWNPTLRTPMKYGYPL